MDDRERQQKRIDEERLETERRKWLLTVTEDDSLRLNMTDRYDRIRFLRETLADRLVDEAKFRPTPHQNREWKNLYN